MPCVGLRSLSLTRWSNRGDDCAESLRRVLLSPPCRTLEKLDLDLSMSTAEMGALSCFLRETGGVCLRTLRVSALEGEACFEGLGGVDVAPGLQVLEVLHADMHGAPAQQLALWILRGGWRSLQELRLVRAGLGKEDVHALVSAMVGGRGCPRLQVLKIEGLRNGVDGDVLLQLVGAALRSQALGGLEELGLAVSGAGNDGVLELAAGLQGSTCAASLKRLDLRMCDVGAAGGAGVASILRACEGLESLELGATWDEATEEDGTRALAEVLEAGAGRRLKRLSLGGIGQGADVSRAFVRAFRRGSCPCIEDLVLLPLDSVGGAVRTALRAKRPHVIVNGYRAGGGKGRHQRCDCSAPAS
jgi:hypothetical protein